MKRIRMFLSPLTMLFGSPAHCAWLARPAWLMLCHAALAMSALAGSMSERMLPMPFVSLCDTRGGGSQEQYTGIAGQAFILRNGNCPHLFARTSLGSLGIKEMIVKDMGWNGWWKAVDCGRFGAGESNKHGWERVDDSWTHTTLEYGDECSFTISRIVPAFLLETSASGVFLLKPTLSGKTDISEVRVGWLAMMADERLAVYSCDPGRGALIPEIPNMTEPWILAWCDAEQAINVLPADHSDAQRPENRNYGADMPWLFILQRSPREIVISPAAGLELYFFEEAGKIVGLPLFGNRLPAIAETKSWKNGLPPEAIENCRRWAGYLRYFPRNVIETARMAENGDIILGESFDYIEIKDEWETRGVKAGFIPPMLGLVSATSRAIEFSDSPVSLNMSAFAGEIQAVESESYEARLKFGSVFDKQLHPKTGIELSAPALEMQSRLESEVDWCVAQGHLAPFFPFTQKLWAEEYLHVYPCWRRPETMIRALMAAYPHMDKERQAKVKDYLQAEFTAYPPVTTGSFPLDRGVRRETYPCGPAIYDNEDYKSLTKGLEKQLNRVVPETMYALWEYASRTGDWDFIRENWPAIRDYAVDLAGYQQWDTCGFQSCPYFALKGGAGDINIAAACFLGVARMAGGIGDTATGEVATTAAAKLFACRIGMQNYYNYMRPRLDKDSGAVAAWEAAPHRRIIHRLDEMGPRIWNEPTPNFQSGLDVTFMGMTPELGACLTLYAGPEVDLYRQFIAARYLLWQCSKSPTIGIRMEENPFNSPQLAWGTFLLHALVKPTEARILAEYCDIPWCRGDWFYIEKLAHTLTAFKGFEWKPLPGGSEAD